ncbi:MAG: DNA polymerase III subunit tau [Firmicutes bacterium ADurb.Bin080]|jgi:DNA polymerase-3 subunit gamma/tau|nr:DNA polymerase III subunit gamma/tau [Clostridiales bacterium]OQC12320.1 MAG: DNA polymerase III subunit tau [Firmicutes bacterium ADurb.Bin080]
MAQHISLYRKYRPDSWEKVIGQKHIVTTLINQIKSDRLTHAYLFTGTRGTGKTSSAKIFAKALNCLNPQNGSPCNKCEVCLALSAENNLDVVEMDAASNNSVDDIRELREKIQYPPTIAKYKVYIIDEVHMLSGSAFNALLKTLEEPPSHAIFILATTEVNKLPQTILSRCMRFDFRLVSVAELSTHLASIFDLENYKYDKKAIEQIAIHGQGSVRDTLSLADMCMSYSPDKLKYEDVLEILGSSDNSVLFSVAESLLSGNIGKMLEITSTVYARGKGIEIFNRELSSYFRELIAIKNIEGYISSLSSTEQQQGYKLVRDVDNYRLARILEILALAENSVRYSSQQKIVFDANLVKAAEIYTDKSNEGYLSRITTLEKQIASGLFSIPKQESTETSNTNKTPISSIKTEESKEIHSEVFLKTIAKGPVDVSLPPQFEEEKLAEKTDSNEADTCSTNNNAKRIFGKLIENMLFTYGSSNFTYKALSEISDYEIKDNVLEIRTEKAAFFDILDKKDSKEKITNALNSLELGKFSVTIKKTGEEKKTRTIEQINYLKDIFGDKIDL